MGGSTGNIRTLRSQSGTNGVRTLASILSSDSGLGAGSFKRIYYWAKKNDSSLISSYGQKVAEAYKGRMDYTL
jgi:hypothetical protein